MMHQCPYVIVGHPFVIKHYIDGLMQERRNSIANAPELRFRCTNTTIWTSEVFGPQG